MKDYLIKGILVCCVCAISGLACHAQSAEGDAENRIIFDGPEAQFVRVEKTLDGTSVRLVFEGAEASVKGVARGKGEESTDIVFTGPEPQVIKVDLTDQGRNKVEKQNR